MKDRIFSSILTTLFVIVVTSCIVLPFSVTRAVLALQDGDKDATAFLQQAITNTPSGGTLVIPASTVPYLVSSPLEISRPITILGQGSTIRQAKAGSGLLKITSGNVTIRGLNLQGMQYVTQAAEEKAIALVGASAANPLTTVEVSDCTLDTWGMYGLYIQYVECFTIRNCTIRNVNYAGVMALSVKNGVITQNSVSNIINKPNAYGIAVTRITTSQTELASDPCSEQVLIEGNFVNGVASWEGLDTHAGRKILFLNNRILNCNRGIAVGPANNSAGVSTYPPTDCVVQGNIMDSGVTDGTAVYGVSVTGCSSKVGTITAAADGCVVSGNSIRGYGSQSNALGMAMYFHSTRGLSVAGNVVVEPGKSGIGLYYNNLGFVVSGNTVQDPWSNAGDARAIWAISDWNQGLIGGNSHVRGTKTATNVLNIGLAIGDFPNNVITVTKDFSNATTALYDPGKHSR